MLVLVLVLTLVLLWLSYISWWHVCFISYGEMGNYIIIIFVNYTTRSLIDYHLKNLKMVLSNLANSIVAPCEVATVPSNSFLDPCLQLYCCLQCKKNTEKINANSCLKIR